MKTKFNLITSLTLPILLLLAFSCKDEKDEIFSATDANQVTEEAQTEFYFQDMDDMGTVAMGSTSQDQLGGSGRYKSNIVIDDNRFKCNGVVVTLDPTGTVEAPAGTITVDFGTAGCTDLRGNVRKGKLIYTYVGKRFEPGSTLTVTPQNYSINGIKIEGSRTSTNITGSSDIAPKFNTILTDGKATFENGEIAYRESNITWQLVKSLQPAENYLLIDETSTANGTTRGGHEYMVTLSKALKYKRFCGIAVEGVKDYVIDGSKEISIDYGDGSCDKTITITANGITRTVTVN